MTVRVLAAGIVFGAVFAPLSAVQAQSYGPCTGFFFPCGTGPGAPREELVVYAWGPGTTTQSPYNSYQPYQQNYYQPAYQPTYQPAYQPSYYQPTYQYSYQPQYYPQYSYGYPQYDYYDSYAYAPQYGYGPQPLNDTDIFGNQLCDWGSGYYGYACSRDPHQWIMDTYTGQYY